MQRKRLRQNGPEPKNFEEAENYSFVRETHDDTLDNEAVRRWCQNKKVDMVLGVEL